MDCNHDDREFDACSACGVEDVEMAVKTERERCVKIVKQYHGAMSPGVLDTIVEKIKVTE